MSQNASDIIRSLASTQADSLSGGKRHELMTYAVQSLEESFQERKRLANRKDLICWSKYGYQRIAKLLVAAIKVETEKPQLRKNLCLRLCLVLQESGDINLVEKCRCLIDVDIMQTLSKENLAAWSLFPADWETFVKLALNGDAIASPKDMELAGHSLAMMDLSSWESVVGPAVVAKLKAKPESVINFVEGLTRFIPSATVLRSSLVVGDLLTAVMKQLKSSKDSVRGQASHIVQHLGKAAVHGRVGDSSNTSETTLETIVKTLADTKSLTQITQREAVYGSLEAIGKSIVDKKIKISDDVVSQVLMGIRTPLSKEVKTATVLRQKGIDALLHWVVIGKRNGGKTGYDDALAFLRSPVISKNGPDCQLLIGSLVEKLNPDVLESIVLDLWKEDDFVKGLDGLVDKANKKHASSSSIPQIEGLLAVYLSLLQATASSKGELSSSIEKALSAGFLTTQKTSFVFGEPTIKAIASHPIVARIIPAIVSLYIQTSSKTGTFKTNIKGTSAICRAISSSIAHPVCIGNRNPTENIDMVLEKILSYQPIAEQMMEALHIRTNELSLEYESCERALNDSQQAREDTTIPSVKGRLNENGFHSGMDVNVVRRAARKLMSRKISPESIGNGLVLMHIGTSVKSGTRQRPALIDNCTSVVRESLSSGSDNLSQISSSFVSAICKNLGNIFEGAEGNLDSCSEGLHLASRSLILSLGSIASSFNPSVDDRDDPDLQPFFLAYKVCVDELAPRLASQVSKLVPKIESLTLFEVDIYRTPIGVYCKESTLSKKSSDAKVGKSRLTEEEEWELQLKQELAKKKQTEETTTVLSTEEKKILVQQDAKRREYSFVMSSLNRVLAAIDAVAQSDIEVGNACLPILSQDVLALAASTCPMIESVSELKSRAFKTLTTLASCVYEIEEIYAEMIATALVICLRKPQKQDGQSLQVQDKMKVLPLPSPCEAAATTIFEMDEFQEELSGTSFSFLFPVVSAALLGPRTTPGCEGALRVLERHTLLLAGEEKHDCVTALRTDMVASVLGLLQHDRAKTFVDPTPYNALVACYQTDEDSQSSALTTAELAALLDERGALGAHNCRIASMIALGSIASSHRKIVKGNPLIENRIWLNCFENDESIRREARKTWGIVHDIPDLGIDDESLPPPSPMYAISLLPLLNHSSSSIAAAAADAYARGMAAHPKSVHKNVQKLCNSYIESCPKIGSDEDFGAKSKPLNTPVTKPVGSVAKKPLGVPAGLKKKTVKKSALQVAGIGQPKKTKKKTTALTKAMMKPKQERTLGEVDLTSQFKTGPKKPAPEKDTPEKAAARLGYLHALASLSKSKVDIDIETLKLLAAFILAYGIADMDTQVKNASRDTLRDLVAVYGGSDDAISYMLPLLDQVLKSGMTDKSTLEQLSSEKMPQDEEALNRRKEGAVVVLGSVALHLKGPENATKIDATIDMLLDSLKTPNEEVQASVAGCLSKLMKKGNTQERIESILASMLQNCLEGETSAIRRGGAHGIAAAVKGSGIATLKKYGLVAKLEEACSSGSSTNKEGSLFAIELLCTRLGLLFEPYVIVLLPSLLRSFGDASDHVRGAASNTVGLIMSKLSAHGVKLVMPAVLTAFDDSAWRTKQASIRMLGSMCHLAPKQLAQALPKVVPKVIEAFADTHPKVKLGAQEALDEITTVIKNPEISSLSATLLKALTDPADNTSVALEALIATEFLHAIDAPSLALIVPILHRGLRDRAATTKRYGALITGNICTMINDPRDFVPYLPTLIPDLQSILLDPIPDVRSISAKAFGSLTRGLGEDTLPDLRPWMIERLRSEDVSSAERSGAAQGLTEILIASGNDTVERVILDDILPLKSHPSPSTREGVLWVLTFLPPALGQGFTSMLDECLPALISGLSDENEEVRDIGMRAGRVIIRTHGKVHYNKILPILENGMSDVDHRIRLSSLMLVGDLLSMIGGTSVLRTDGDTQDDIRKAEKAQAQVTLILGIEARNRVLSEIYLARSDSAVAVRQTAVQVWKTIVSVTARILRQLLPVLVTRIVSDLASGDVEKTEMAGKCLGDIVGKLGESVMKEIIPVLRDALYTGDVFTRRGVCVGLSEVIASSTKDQIIRYIDIIVKVVQDALCDDNESVRKMAATSFQKLYTLVGNKAMDEVVPALMVALENSGDDLERLERSLNGLTGILSFRSKELLPYIIPRLIQGPITTGHAKAIASIATVTGSTIILHTKTIIPSLLNDLSNSFDDDIEREEAIRGALRSFCASADESGVNGLIGTIAAKCTSDKAEMRRECCWGLEAVISERKEVADFYEEIPIIIRECVGRLNDENQDVLKANHRTLMSLSKNVPAEELVNHVEFMRNLIATLVSDARRRKGGVGDGDFFLPGFNIPKGLEPLLPIYQRGILYGVPSVREASAAGLGEVITLTSNKFLAGPLIIKMTGPLLRIVGDRNPSNVKIAILKTLGLILVKGGPALRAFVPQFQTTFVKALADPSRQVRIEAIHALGLLMPLSTRVDPLLKELVAGSLGKTTGTTDSVGVVAVQTATLEGLAIVLRQGGKKAKLPDSIPSALVASKELLEHADESIREAAAKVLAAACDILGVDTAVDVVKESIMESADYGDFRHGRACAIRRLLSTNVSSDFEDSVLSDLLTLSLEFMKDDKPMVRDAGCVAIGASIGRSKNPKAALDRASNEILRIMENSKESLETHQAVAKGLCLALQLGNQADNIDFLGIPLLNACLKLAMSGAQRVQFAFNDVLFCALKVQEGQEGLDKYASQAMFEDSKQMKSVYSKVLLKIKGVTILDD